MYKYDTDNQKRENLVMALPPDELARINALPSPRYKFAISVPERVGVNIPKPHRPDWTIEVLENPEEVSLWLLAMKLVKDVNDLASKLKDYYVDDVYPGPNHRFARHCFPDEDIFTDLGKEMVFAGEGNRYLQAWDYWKNFRKIAKAVNADTVVGKRKRLGSKKDDDS